MSKSATAKPLFAQMKRRLPSSPEYLLKEEGMMRLSPFLVPYLRNSEVDRISEKILKKYLPEAIDDPHLRNAARLAERMGLTVHHIPLYDHVGIPSVLVWEDGTIPVMDKWRVGQKEPDMVMVPKNSIIVNINDTREECGKAEDYRHEGEKYQIVGKKMAFNLCLPDFRIRTRMIQLGHLPAKGALNYVQKEPIRL